ncbi:MAG: PspA/IM30 family protein [Desulfobacterales bacterium]|nr:PspA/IM30 family protein [Desulfobacterales bacterium]
MSIMTRVINIFKADIHGVMDQLENQELLLKQHLRNMQAALNQKETRLNTMIAALKQTQNESNRYQHQSKVLERDLAVAIRKNTDGVARKLIRKLKPINGLIDELTGQIQTLEEEISNTRNDVDRQRLQYDQIRHKSAEFFRRTRLQTRSHGLPPSELEGLNADLSEEEVELELLKRKEELGAA